MRKFDSNSPDIALAELGTYLKNRRISLFDLSWRRFEELVNDALRADGMQVELTQASHDGGADIIVFGRQGGEIEGIVQCKRWASNRTVGVESVRELVGVAVDWEVEMATLATTSSFSPAAKKLASRYGNCGFSINLKEAADILEMLDCYNSDVPRLHTISEEERKQIIRESLSKIRKDGEGYYDTEGLYDKDYD